MFFKELFSPGGESPLVQAAFADVSGMLQLSARMLDHSLEVLLDNRPIDVDLDHMDDMVDEAERRVRRTILQHRAVNVRQNLVASLILVSMVSMVQDAERIGDVAAASSSWSGSRPALARTYSRAICENWRTASGRSSASASRPFRRPMSKTRDT